MIWIATKDGSNQAMCESARAKKSWACQGDSLGDPNASKPDREGSLFPHISIQEWGAEDTCHPRPKSIIKSNQCLEYVLGGASAEEVHNLTKPQTPTKKGKLNLCVIHLFKMQVGL
jgi:hypothetical protein